MFRTKSNDFFAFLVCFFGVFVFVCMFGSSIWVERRRKPLRARREAMGTRAALQHCHCTVCQTAWCLPRPTKTYQDLPRRIEDAAVQYATVCPIHLSAFDLHWICWCETSIDLQYGLTMFDTRMWLLNLGISAIWNCVGAEDSVSRVPVKAREIEETHITLTSSDIVWHLKSMHDPWIFVANLNSLATWEFPNCIHAQYTR